MYLKLLEADACTIRATYSMNISYYFSKLKLDFGALTRMK